MALAASDSQPPTNVQSDATYLFHMLQLFQRECRGGSGKQDQEEVLPAVLNPEMIVKMKRRKERALERERQNPDARYY